MAAISTVARGHEVEMLAPVRVAVREALERLPRGTMYRSALNRFDAKLADLMVQSEEEAFVDSYWNHVGSAHVALRLSAHVKTALYEARRTWLQELDALDDLDLADLPGVGPKSLVEIRKKLDTYYWRTDAEESRLLWDDIVQRLRRGLEYPYASAAERQRLLAGIKLAEKVLSQRAGPEVAELEAID